MPDMPVTDPAKLRMIRKIKKAMIDRDLTPKSLAAARGCTHQHMSAILSARRPVRMARLEEILNTVLHMGRN